MGRLLEIVTPLHKATKRDVLARMNDDKVHCMVKAKEYEFDYWDGDRRYGYAVFAGRRPVMLISPSGTRQWRLWVPATNFFEFRDKRLQAPATSSQTSDFITKSEVFIGAPRDPGTFKKRLTRPLDEVTRAPDSVRNSCPNPG